VSFASNVPLDGQNDNQPFTVVGDPPVERMRQPNAHYQIVSPRYFEALGITLLQGRGFTGRDTATTVPVCIINEELARRFFAGRDPIGARISIPSIAVRVPVEREIVGVIRQVAVEPVETERAMQIYVPLAQNAWQSSMMAVRTEGDPVQLVPSIKAAIARADRYQAAWRVRTMEQVASDATSRPRFRAQLVGVFASLAAMLAAIGIFSVLMFTVQQRAREFGIRMALGARAGDIFRLVLGGALRLTGAGLAIGLIASFLLVRSLTTLLFGIEPFDLLAFAAATIGVAAVALAACLAPALRAMRADPAHALRAE
jgi:putative ABC transport system permease protein